MTNSPSKPPVKKAKGPIRWEAVIAATVFSVLVGVYFSFFFDGHLRRALQYVGTQVNGAEVNIASLSTSFIRADLQITNIQVTDKNQPERNLIQVGSIRFKMIWDALLRAKVVVDEASILDIQALTKRKSPGYVVPPPPPSSGPSVLERAERQVLDQTKKRYSKNFLSDVASVIGGTDAGDQLKNIQGNLKSDARIKQLDAELKAKKAAWDQRIKDLPQQKELKEYEARIKALKFDANKPAEFAKSVSEAEKIIREVDQKVKLVQQTSKDVKGDLNTYNQAYKDLEKMVQDDLKDLQTRFKLPDVNAKEFSQQLFMSMIESKIVSLRKYIALAREYSPPLATKEQRLAKKQEQIVPPKRGDGKTYRFPITTSYPLFWLKHAAISSELGTSEFSGNIKGEIKDFSTSPEAVPRPAMILVKGDFPKQNIYGLDATVTLDHRTEVAKDSVVATVAAFPVGQTKLSEGSDVSLSIDQAKGSSFLQATLVNQELTVETKNSFGDLKYGLEAKNKIVKDILDGVLQGIPTITVNAGIKGSFDDFDVNINSNLGNELAHGFKRVLQAKIDEAKAKLKKSIDEKIGTEKAKLKAEIDKATADLTKLLDGKQAEVDKALADAKGGSQSGQSPQKKLEDEGSKLLKKLKF